MKPSGLSRRTPIKRTGIKSRTDKKTVSSADIPTTSLHAVSTRTYGKKGSAKRAEQERRKKVREIVFDNAGRRCELAGVDGAGPCFGVLTFHHKLKASQGGGYTVENGACLCAHHNSELEGNVRLAGIARSMRLVVLSWEQER